MISYKPLLPRIKPARVMTAVGAECDVCGRDAWYPAHGRPVATLSRVRDDDRSNMDLWELDLCEECKDFVMRALRERAKEKFERVMPQHRPESAIR